MEAELNAFAAVVEHPKRPLLAILGAKPPLSITGLAGLIPSNLGRPGRRAAQA